MKSLILFLFLFIQCQSQKSIDNCNINTNASQIVEGKIAIEIINNKNVAIKVPKEIDNNALIITDFQRIIKEGIQYEDVERPIIHFDCLNPCFPLTYKLKKGEKKIYTFNIFNPITISKNNKYRIKLSLENYFGKECGEVKTEWIYFDMK